MGPRANRRHRGKWNRENDDTLTDEQKAKITNRKNTNKTFDRQVNTRNAKFTPLRGFKTANANNITVIVNKGENKVTVKAICVLSDVAKNKTTIRKESTVVEELHTLPPYIKNQNMGGQITAKY